MGVAAWNRGSGNISRQLDNEARPSEFRMMDDLNALPKFDCAQTPFGDINFIRDRGVWVAECPKTGKGYWYKTLRDAVRSWNVSVIGYENGVWRAIPNGR